MNRKDSSAHTYIIITVYAIVTFFILMHHEPWRDEAYTWLVARDLGPWGIIKQTGHTGHPALWTFIVAIFAKLGFPYISELVMHWMIAVAAVWTLLRFSPFSTLTKLLIVFSYYIGFEYVIIARNYNLSVLLLFLIAAIYHRKLENPGIYALLVFFLFNTNVHSFAAAAALGIVFFAEAIQANKSFGKYLVPVAVMLLGACLAFLQLWAPWSDTYHALGSQGVGSPVNLRMPLISLANSLIPRSGDEAVYQYISVAALILFIFRLARCRQAFFFFLFSLAGLWYILAFKYPGALRHHGLILIFFIFSFWIALQDQKAPEADRSNVSRGSIVTLNLFLGASVIFCFMMYYTEFRSKYSDSKSVAKFLIENQYSDLEIGAYRSSIASSVLPYLGNKKFWYLDFENYGSYITWNKKYIEGLALTDHEIVARFNRKFKKNASALLLMSRPLEESAATDFKLLYQTPGEVFGIPDEIYFIYKYAASK